MDILPGGNIFRELENICKTGYFSSQTSIEDQWQQVSLLTYCDFLVKDTFEETFFNLEN